MAEFARPIAMTVVCVRCHRGWWAERSDERCSQCGQVGELRGVVHVVPLRQGTRIGTVNNEGEALA